MDYRLDLTSYRCPLPLLMTKRALATLQQGDRLFLSLAPDAAVNDIHRLCQMLDLSASEVSDPLQLCIEKPANKG